MKFGKQVYYAVREELIKFEKVRVRVGVRVRVRDG